MEAAIGAVLGVLFFAGGFLLGWYSRDKVRVADEPHVPLVEKPIGKPIDIPIAGRHIPPKR